LRAHSTSPRRRRWTLPTRTSKQLPCPCYVPRVDRAMSGRRPHPVPTGFALVPGGRQLASQECVGARRRRTREAIRDGCSMGNHRIVVGEAAIFILLDFMQPLRAGAHAAVGTADSAAEAIRVVERERPDLVLMDVRLLGERDGIEAATEIWQRFAIRSLLVSANLDSAMRAKASAANPIGFLGKPYTPSGLLAAVAGQPSLDRAMGRPRA